jgi:hypothetical protein
MFHCVSHDKEHYHSFHCVMDMVLLLNIASKPTYSFLYDMYNVSDKKCTGIFERMMPNLVGNI